jgi:hypothetical protein
MRSSIGDLRRAPADDEKLVAGIADDRVGGRKLPDKALANRT